MGCPNILGENMKKNKNIKFDITKKNDLMLCDTFGLIFYNMNLIGNNVGD